MHSAHPPSVSALSAAFAASCLAFARAAEVPSSAMALEKTIFFIIMRNSRLEKEKSCDSSQARTRSSGASSARISIATSARLSAAGVHTI